MCLLEMNIVLDYIIKSDQKNKLRFEYAYGKHCTKFCQKWLLLLAQILALLFFR